MTKNRPKAVRKKTSVTSRIPKSSSKRRLISAKKLAKRPAKGKRPLLLHHAHTGKRVSVHHSSFAILGLMVLLVGILLASISFNVNASDLAVSAKVSAALPSGPATITSPSDQDVVTSVPIVLNGTCPADEIVKLYRDGSFAGSVQCTALGAFTLQINLLPGANSLQARIFNSTDDEGPTSPSITVFYNPPSPPPPTPTPTPTPQTGNTQPTPTPTPTPAKPRTFVIESTDTAINSIIGNQVDIQFTAVGGVPFYVGQIDWGDGRSNTYKDITDKPYTISHTYDDLGDDFGRFTVKIKLTDALGGHSFLQIAVNITGPKDAKVPRISFVNESSGPHSTQLTLAIFGITGVSISVVSFWLGSHWIVNGVAVGSKWKHGLIHFK